jgi:hypothetical protein
MVVKYDVGFFMPAGIFLPSKFELECELNSLTATQNEQPDDNQIADWEADGGTPLPEITCEGGVKLPKIGASIG